MNVATVPAPARLTCRRTGSPRGTGACLGSSSGACGYCGLPAADAEARAAALAGERAQLIVEGFQ